MSREAAEPLDDELDGLIIEGLEGAESEADRAANRFAGTEADDDQGGAPADDHEDDDEFVAAEPTSAARTAAPAPAAAAKPADDVDDDNPIITRSEDGAKWNHSAGRWQKDGKFVEGEAPRGYTAAAGTTGAPAAGTESAAAPAAAAAEQSWQPFAVQVDRAQSVIPEAQVSRANGHHFLAIPDDKMPEFQRRIVRGVAAERMWRQLDTGLKDLERERELAKNRPAIRSDSEVEADMMLAAIKDRLPELFDEQTLENLSLKITIAQRDEREKAGTWEKEQRTQTTEQETTQREQMEGIATTLIELVDDPRFKAEFSVLTQADLEAVMQELAPVRNAIYAREGKEWVRNQQYMYDRLRQRVLLTAASRTTAAPAAGTSTTGATTATPPAGGTTATSSATTRAERLNRAHDTAARPASTSVKAGRTAGSRPAATAAHHREPPKDSRPAAQVVEDQFRKTQRSFLNSPSLDFEEPDED